jgi:hypothetical protein
LRIHGQSPGDGGPLLLAARPLDRKMVAFVGNAHLFKQRFGMLNGLVFGFFSTCTGASMTFSNMVL